MRSRETIASTPSGMGAEAKAVTGRYLVVGA